jgi:hypothetical protein
MSGDNGKEINQGTQPQEEKPIQMVITFHPTTGKIEVVGPINNRTLSYGMLEMAKEAIYDLKEKMKSQIQVPGGGIMNFVRRKH